MSYPASVPAIKIAWPTQFSRKFLGDTGWVMVANLAQAAGPFVGLLVIARWHGMAAAGQFAYAQALTAPIAQLLNLQLKALLLTHQVAELPLGTAVSIRILTSVVGVALILLLLFASGPLTGIWMGSRLADSWAELFQADLQRAGRMSRAAISVVLRAAGLVVLLALSASLEAALLGYVLFSLLLLFTFDWQPLRRQLNWNWAMLRPLVYRGVMLGVVLCLQAANSSIPRIVLEQNTDASTLGIFVTASVVLQAGNLLASAFGQILLPAMANSPLFRIASWTLVPFFAALFALFITVAASSWLLAFFHLASNSIAENTLLALSLAQLTIWPATMLGYALTARRLYREMLWLGLGLIVVSSFSSWLLVIPFGSVGAAMSIASSGLATVLICFWLLSRSSPRNDIAGATS